MTNSKCNAMLLGFIAYIGVQLSTQSLCADTRNGFCSRTLLQRPLVVIGASAAGTGVIKELAKRKFQGEVLWLADQTEQPYKTTQLKSILDGAKSVQEISTIDLTSLPSHIHLRLGIRVVKIDPLKQNVFLEDGAIVPYSGLFLGIGMNQDVPEEYRLKGVEGIFSFNNLNQAIAIKNYSKKKALDTAIVVGLGLNGLEVANVFVKHGIKVHAVEKNSRVLHNLTDSEGALFLQAAMSSHVNFHFNTSIKQIEHENNQVKSVILTDGTKITSCMVIFTIGGRPSSEWLKNTGLAFENGYLVVDTHLKTTVPSIYAGGDGVAITDLATGKLRRSCKWHDGEEQGKSAARNMLGESAEYTGSLFTMHSKFFGFSFISCGSIASPTHYERIVFRGAGFYHLFLRDNAILKGFLLIDKHAKVNRALLTKLMKQKSPVSLDELSML
jgi:NAD(P)H-nitrite reductase large subunit